MNSVQHWIRRYGWITTVLLALLLISSARYWQPHTTILDVGNSYTRPRLSGFYADETLDTTSYAYTTDHSSVQIPGTGAGSRVIALDFNGWRPEGVEAAQVQIDLDAHQLSVTPRTVPARYTVFGPSSSGTTALSIASNAFRPAAPDQRRLGIPLDQVSVQVLSHLPAWPLLAQLLGLEILIWLYGMRCGLSTQRAALGPALIGGLWLAAWFTSALLAIDALNPLLIAALLSHGLLGPLRTLLRWLQQRFSLPLSIGGRELLLGLFGLVMLWKVGGMLYPHIRVFDEAAHTKRVQWIFEGRFGELYYPNYTSFMGETVGLEGGYLPYSPLWYLVVAPLYGLGLPIGAAMNGLSGVLDALKGVMVAVLALATLRQQRVAILALIMYSLLPMPYYLLSWGNYPTQFGLWAALLVLVVLSLKRDEWLRSPTTSLLRQRGFWVWVGTLFLSMATYTVTGILTWIMLGIWAMFETINQRRQGGRAWKLLLAGVGVAEAILFAIYHIQFASIIVNNTLPALLKSSEAKSQTPLEVASDPRASAINNFLDNTSFLRNHTSDALLVVIAVGLVALLLARDARRWWPLWASWLSIALIFTAVSAFVADMVLKHLFFVMPLMALAVAWMAHLAWQRWRPSRWIVMAGLIGLSAWTVERWHFYLLIKRH